MKSCQNTASTEGGSGGTLGTVTGCPAQSTEGGLGLTPLDWLLGGGSTHLPCPPPGEPSPDQRHKAGLTVAQARCAFPRNDLIACLELPVALMIIPRNRGNNWLRSRCERAPCSRGAEPVRL